MIESPALELSETRRHALAHLPPGVAGALSHFVDNLLARFGDDIRRVILYGSCARGDWHSESDVDVMVVVAWEEEKLPDGWYRSPYSDPRWQAIIDIAVESTLESERYFSPLVVSETLFQISRGDAVAEGRREGIQLYNRLADATMDPSLAAPGGTYSITDHAPGAALKEVAADRYGDEPAEWDDPRLWLSLADEKLLVARELFIATHYHDAVSRLYYGMFYAAKAALLSIDIRVKSHAGVISQFGRFFVKVGRVEARFETMLSRANEDRMRSDYRPKSRPEREDVEQALRDAETFSARARELVEAQLSRRGA